MQEEKLTIIELTANNFTNLKAVRITPDKNVMVLTGANEAGKSNILDLIQALLEGLKVKMPIREGEERADATLDLGDIKIRKRWTAKGEGLEVYKIVDGKKQILTSPMTVLDEITGRMIDPMRLYSLMKHDPKKFRDTLANLVGLDLQDLKSEEDQIRLDRKLINDKVRDAIAQLNEMTAPNPDTPDEEMTFKEKLDDVNRLREKKTLYDDEMSECKRLKENIERVNNNLKEFDDKIVELQEMKESSQKAVKNYEEALKVRPGFDEITPEQILAAEANIETIETRNVEIREAKRYRTKVKESQKFKKESDAFTEKISRIQQDIQTRIASCKFPVEGLSLTEDNVFFEGKPIEIASSGRQIRIFVKMAISLSPNVKVLLIRDGSYLDKAAFAEICEIAQKEGYQIWMEKTDETGEVGLFIENGEITAVDGKKVVKELVE